MKKLDRLLLGFVKDKAKGCLKINRQNKKLCKQIHVLVCAQGNINHAMLDNIDEQLSDMANRDRSLKEIL